MTDTDISQAPDEPDEQVAQADDTAEIDLAEVAEAIAEAEVDADDDDEDDDGDDGEDDDGADDGADGADQGVDDDVDPDADSDDDLDEWTDEAIERVAEDEADDDLTDDASSGPTVRTRTRTRGARATSPADGEDAAGDEGADDSAGGDAATEGAGAERRRRRRGGRGRGRRSAETQSDTGSDDAATEDAGANGEPAARTAEPGSVEDDITRVGTRMAARRQQRDRGRRGSSNGRTGRSGDRRNEVSDEARRAILDGPPRTMLVSTRDDRTQIAVLEDRTLVEHYVTRKADVSFVGNIYMGRVQNVLPGMEAAFLDIGKGRNGVLYAGEVLYDDADVEDAQPTRIEQALKPGQKVLVQVTKDPMGSKGARLTMQLSLAGRYMVLAPGDGVFGISRKLGDEERERLRRIMKKLRPEGTGVIVRTAAADATEDQLREDLERLVAKWQVVEERANSAKALEAVYEEPDLVTRVIRDTFGAEVEQVVIDSEDVYERIKGYLEEVAPEQAPKVSLYQPEEHKDEATPSLFDAYHVDEQLKKALDRKVWLPSGGYLVIDRTEAMTIVDVNTGRFTGSSGSNLEETVLKTNLEAAEEIVRQLRLRDIGGMIIIDFIDMLLKANQDQVVRRLKRELLRDRTKTRVSEISRLGLVQMTRKNVSQGLVEAFSEKCKECEGRGYAIHLDA